MRTDRSRHGYPTKAEPRLHWAAPPAWWLRVQLRWASRDIALLELALHDEFGLLETAPQLAELALLRARRDELARKLDRRK